MISVHRIIWPLRLFRSIGKQLHLSTRCKFINFNNFFIFNTSLKLITDNNMSQRSITTFFNKTPKVKNTQDPNGGTQKNEKTSTKRVREQSSGSDQNSPIKKKPVKRLRIVSTSSDDLSPIKENIQHTMKVENTSPHKEEPSPDASQTDEAESLSAVTKGKQSKGDTEGDLLPNVTELDYNPAKAKYHPIKDACWSRGIEVPYLALAKTLEAIEATSARLKMIEILSNYFRSVMALTPEDLLPSVYLCLNRLAPAHRGLELGVAETYLMKAIGRSTGRSLAQVKAALDKAGDLGLVAQTARTTQRTMVRPRPLVLREVLEGLREIARMTGRASVDRKIAKIQSLYVACRHSEARYLIRSLAGKLRVGLAEQSALQALALAAATAPPPLVWPPTALDAAKHMTADAFKARVEQYALTLKTTYCECPDYELVLPVLLEHGVSALPDRCRLTPGLPLKPMLAHPSKGVREALQRFDDVDFTCEWKYDGERAQIHVPADGDRPELTGAKLFSRNQEDNTTKYPDVLRRLPGLLKPNVSSCVLDCEAVAFDVKNEKILPFQILSTRKRKDASEADIKVQVCVFVFDLLYLNGRALVREPLRVRRDLLREHFNQVPGEWLFATAKDCGSAEEVAEFLEEAVRGSCEGLMVKTLAGKDATYEIARRSRNWLKLKKDYLEGVGDSVDAVVLGGYLGRGKRAGLYGGFLLACHHPELEEFQSLCKIGTGFTDEDLHVLGDALRELVIEGPKPYYRVDRSHEPDVWFEARVVWEVRCADLSLSPSHRAAAGLVDPEKGVSLRFPRFVRVREDKTPEQATSARQIADMYLAQDQIKNGPEPVGVHPDDFY